MKGTILTCYELSADELLELSGGVRLSFADRLAERPALRQELRRAVYGYLEALWESGGDPGKQPSAAEILRIMMQLGMPGTGQVNLFAMPVFLHPTPANTAEWQQQKRFEQNFPALLERAKRCDAQALYLLGTLYNAGKYIPKDEARAASFFRLAAAKGHTGARYLLGYACLIGKGVPQDTKKGLGILQEGAAANDPDALRLLGCAYLDGTGVITDKDYGLRLLKQAADQDDLTAQLTLARIYRNGSGIRRDPVQARKWEKRAEETRKKAAP